MRFLIGHLNGRTLQGRTVEMPTLSAEEQEKQGTVSVAAATGTSSGFSYLLQLCSGHDPSQYPLRMHPPR